MNDVSKSIVGEVCDQDEVEDDLDGLCGELDDGNKSNGDPTEQFILEDELIENVDGGEKQPVNPRQLHMPRKQLTCNRKVHIDSSTDEANH